MAQPEPMSDPAPTTSAADARPESLAPGTVLDERYEVERVLGRGGMGYVVAARHLQLGQRVAIKLLLPAKMSAQGQLRLVREARTVARLRSDHVIRVLDVVSSGPNAPYIVMEYLEGETLAERIARKGPLAALEVVEILLQTAEAVGEAHLLGVVHRDLKPSNLFMVARPGQERWVKVLDFGISKTEEAGQTPRLTQSHALLASPAYAPPEQLRTSRDVDRRADVWSLGVIAYECLSGRLPFRGQSLPEVCAHILREDPVSLRDRRGDVPAALERVIFRCLEKDPARRCAGIEELVGALRQFSPGSARKCLAYLRELQDPDASHSSRRNPLSSTRPSDRSRRGVGRVRFWTAVALPLALAGASAAFLHLQHEPRTEAAAASSSAPRPPAAQLRSEAAPLPIPSPDPRPTTPSEPSAIPMPVAGSAPAPPLVLPVRTSTKPSSSRTASAHPPTSSSPIEVRPVEAPWVESR